MSRDARLPAAALLYAALVAWPAWPLSMATHLVGNNVDNWIYYWNDWWLRTSLAAGQAPWRSDMIFVPHGTDLLAHSYNYVNSLLAVALSPTLGAIGAHNAVLLAMLWVGGLGMYLLVRDLTATWEGALLAGIAFMLAPYHLTQALAHDHLGAIQWWPWFALALRRALHNGPLRHRLRAGLFVGFFAALTFWSGLQLALLLALWALGYLAWRLAARQLPRQAAPPLMAAAITTLVLCAPLLIPLLANLDALRTATGEMAADLNQTDLLAYFVPPTYHPLVGDYVVPIYERFRANRAFAPYLGLSALVLAVHALRRRDESVFWGVTGLVAVILALGSRLRLAGRLWTIRLPYDFVDELFPISVIRVPDRFNLIVVFALAVLVGLGAHRLLAARRRAPALLLAGLLLLEFMIWPWPAWPPLPRSPYMATLAALEDGTAVYDFPADYQLSKQLLYYQTLHGRPTVAGHFSRYDESTYRFILETPLLRSLLDLSGAPPNLMLEPAPPLTAAQREASLARLRANDVRYVLHHRAFSNEAQRADFYTLYPYQPIYKDASLEVFDLTALTPFQVDPAAITRPTTVRFGDHIQLRRYEWQLRGSELHLALTWEVDAPPPADYKLFVHLVDDAGQLVRQYDAMPCAWQCPTTGWRPAVRYDDVALLELFDLPPGSYAIRLGLYDPVTGARLPVGAGEWTALAPGLILAYNE